MTERDRIFRVQGRWNRGGRHTGRTFLRILGACTLAGLCVSAIAGEASARGGGGSGPNYYVSSSGQDASNDCVSHHFPCQTIAHALVEQGIFGNGGTIHVGPGTYTGQLSIGALNSSVTIVGTSTTKTVIQPPATGLTGSVDPNSVNPVHAIIDISRGASNVAIEKLTVNGTNGVSSLDTDGQGCAQSYVGIFFDDASGTVSGAKVNGMDVPSDQLDTCTSGRGIYVASDGSASSTVTMNQVSLAAASCTSTLALPLAVGTYSGTYVSVKRIKHSKTCKFHGGPVLIDGALLQAQPFGTRTITVTGTMPYQAPGGSIVSFTPLASAYDDAGIVCENATTSCAISGGTVQGMGPNDQVSQNGIEILGASATIDSTKVSNNSFTGGVAGEASAGIKAVNGGTVELTGNSVTNNDINIDGTWNPALGVTDPPTYPPLSPGRAATTPDAITTAGQSTLTSATANFQLSDVGRSVAAVFTYPDGAVNVNANFSDGVTNGTNVFTSATANFTSADVGLPIVETDAQTEIFANTVITAVSNSTTVTLSHAAPSPATGIAFNLPMRPTTFTSASADFTTADVGKPIVEADFHGVIPLGTTISTVLSTTSVLVSNTLAGSATSISFTLPSRPNGINPGTYIAGVISPAVALLSQPANQTMSGLAVTLGALPGTWAVTGNTASSATALGSSAGTPGYGEGIEIDSVDGCVDGNQNAAVVIRGNTASNNAHDGILFTGSSCALIGGTVAGQSNTASGNQVGLKMTGPGSACSPCSGPSSPGYDSADNIVVGNSFSSNTFGLIARGLTASQSYGGPPSIGPATTGNVLNGNTWSANTVANAVDFTGWGGLTIGGLSFTLGATPAGSYNSLTATSPQTLPAGRIVAITQAGLPDLIVLVSSAVTGATTIPVTPFTATGDYTAGAAQVNQFTDVSTANTFGLSTHDSCEPSANGSASFDGVTFSAGYFSC